MKIGRFVSRCCLTLCLLGACLSGVKTAPTYAHDDHPVPVLHFTEAELRWMGEHDHIRVAPDPDFPPVEILDDKGAHQGIAADFLHLVGERLPIHFDIVRLENWDEVIRQARSREVDMLSAAVPTPERLGYLRFTTPFVRFPAVVLVRENMVFPPKVHDLEGMSVAVVSNYAAHDFMRERYPGVDLKVMPDIASGLRQVSFGRVDAMVLNVASATYYIEKLGITNLRIYRDTEFTYDLSFAVRSDWPELQAVLQKAVDSITPAEAKSIISPWVNIKRVEWRPTNIQLLIGMAVVGIVVLLAVLLWVGALRAKVALRSAELHAEFQERLRIEKEKEVLQKQLDRGRKMEALGLLAGGVAHDLNNILSAIVSYPELMLAKLPPDDSMRKPLMAIHESGLRAAAVVADLLTVARGAASSREPLDLCALVQDHFHSPEFGQLRERFPDAEIEHPQSRGSCMVQCSAVHVRKALHNLLGNALEALPDGRGKVSLQLSRVQVEEEMGGYETIPPGAYVRIRVSDNGQGIAAGDLEHIFEPFYTKKVMGISGTGLGLTVVWSTVRDHDGYLDVASSPGQTHFDLYFPECALPAYSAEKISNGIPKGRGELVLVVDDDPGQREIACGLLEHLGYRAVGAGTSDEAVEAARRESPDLVLLDMILRPGEDGAGVYERLLLLCPGLKAVIASGYAETSEVVKAQKLGAGAFIRKPYTSQILGEVVAKELGRTSLDH